MNNLPLSTEEARAYHTGQRLLKLMDARGVFLSISKFSSDSFWARYSSSLGDVPAVLGDSVSEVLERIAEWIEAHEKDPSPQP